MLTPQRNAITFVLLLLTAACTVNQDERYYNGTACQITADPGIHTTTGTYSTGGAFTNDATNNFIQVWCDVPYTRSTGNLESIVVRARVLDGASNETVSIQLCERSNDTGGTCHDEDSTGVSFTGLDTLVVSFTPTAETRWPYIRLRVVGESGAEASGLIGYRVCRGGCS